MDMNDEQLMALLAQLGSADSEMGDLDTQLAAARQLKSAPMASATVQAGANQIVPNYAGAIDRAVSGYQGRTQEKDLASQRAALLGKQTEARTAYGKALMADPNHKKTLEEELMGMQMPSARF